MTVTTRRGGKASSPDSGAEQDASTGERIVSDKEARQIMEKGGNWGRPLTGECGGVPVMILLMAGCPLLVSYFIASCNSFDCSITQPALDVINHKLTLAQLFDTFPVAHLPSITAVQAYAAWFVFQFVLYIAVPGVTRYGQVTPTGAKLKYNINGVAVWFITHILAVVLWYKGIINGGFIYDHWADIMATASIWGFILTVALYYKGLYWPTNNDRKISGTFLYDLFMGTELNPRIGNIDLKLFLNGRPGIVAWTVINLSFTAKQYELYGTVTWSMILVNIFHFNYVMDFFIGEAWYLGTLDIMHDHVGFYLAWGDVSWLPFMYTLQGFYLVTHPVELSTWYIVLCVALNLFGLYIFRAVNSQKRYFRESSGKGKIWGKTPTFIEAQYMSKDGIAHTSLLLTSGWWGLARHINYFGDLVMSATMCMPCGYTHLLPWFYLIYMTILLIHRIHRDHVRCLSKYGKYYAKYCDQVPYKLLPYIW